MRAFQSDDAFEKIREKIVSMEWAPGTRLSSNQIAAELGMSRTPVERALVNLERYGLVEAENGKYSVSTFSLNDIVELYQVKEAIETQAVKILLERGGLSDEQLKELRATAARHSAAAEEADNSAFFQEGMEFHFLLVQYAANSRLLQIHQMIRYETERAQLLNLLFPKMTDSISEHERLIDALARRDLAAALAAVSEHSCKTIERYQNILSQPTFHRAVLQLNHLPLGSPALSPGGQGQGGAAQEPRHHGEGPRPGRQPGGAYHPVGRVRCLL